MGVRFLLPFGLLAVAFSIFILFRTYLASQRHVNELVSQQAALALEFNLAIRDYAAEKIRPVMERLVSKDQFIPEAMSTSFISRGIFEKVRARFPDCFIHFASDNPRNTNNQASPDERRMIEYFRKNPQESRRTDFVQINGRRYLAHFTPMRMVPACLRCHGEPKEAPAELVERYGATASFHRVVGDVAALDTVAIPVDTINAALTSEMRRQSIILAAGLAFLFGAVAVVFRLVVTRRLSVMAEHFQGIAAHPESPWLKPVPVKGKDEIGVMAAAFNRLVEQLHAAQALLELRVSQRTSEWVQANEKLRQEIQDRQQAEEQLKDSKEYLKRVIDCVGDPIFVKDEHHRYVMANTAEYNLTGKSSSQLLGKSDDELFPAGQAEEFRRRDTAVLATGQEDVNEEQLTDAQGRIRTVITKKTLLTDRSGKKQIVGVIRDITDYKLVQEKHAKLESQLRQSQKMEAIGTLAGGIAHDFNNILSIIIPNTELAQGEADGNATVKECLAEVLKAADRAKDLVKQILAFSRQTPFVRKPILLQPVIQEVVKMLRSTLPSTVEISTQVEAGAPQILADPIQVHQVLMNLCTNAAQAMKNQLGHIHVQLETLTVDADSAPFHPEMKSGVYAKLSVSDTGVGMNDETLKRIFEPFFTTKAPGEGTGLGLAVVHGIVKEHDGYIDASSQPGKGTLFQIYFPACPVQPAELPRSSSGLPQGRGERILFVDDEPHLTQIAHRCLKRLGYNINTCERPLDALEEFSRHPEQYDLVFTDLTMPKMTGIDLAQKLLEIRSDIPILLATGFNGVWNQEEVRALGIKQLVLKPFTPTVLARVIAETLQSSQKAPV